MSRTDRPNEIKGSCHYSAPPEPLDVTAALARFAGVIGGTVGEVEGKRRVIEREQEGHKLCPTCGQEVKP
jgi:hypothetical protein